jgi:hypothetical protein
MRFFRNGTVNNWPNHASHHDTERYGIKVFAAGACNPFGICLCSNGNIHATTNGPNNGYGDMMTEHEPGQSKPDLNKSIYWKKAGTTEHQIGSMPRRTMTLDNACGEVKMNPAAKATLLPFSDQCTPGTHSLSCHINACNLHRKNPLSVAHSDTNLHDKITPETKTRRQEHKTCSSA